ncbi:unnamed protein product, partial [Pylaiella littoralis]
KKNPNRTTTCGNQQGFLVSQLDIQGVLDRQKEREGNGDNGSYVLARTIRSNLQYVFVYCVCSRVFWLRDRFGVPRKGIYEVAYVQEDDTRSHPRFENTDGCHSPSC